MIDNFLEFLASELGQKDATELATLKAEDGKLKEGFQAILKPLFSKLKVERFNAGKSEGKTEGKGWAERENKQKWEKEFAIKLGVEAAPIDDMIKAYQEKNKAGAKTKELTENDILNHESHLKVVNKLKEDLKNITDERDTLKSEKDTSSKVSDLTGIFSGLKDKYLMTDKAFQDRMSAYIKSQPLKKEGDVYSPIDQHGNPLRSSDNSDIISIVDHFEKTQIDGYFLPKEHKSDTPGDKGKGDKDDKSKIEVPSYKSENEWRKAILTETDTDKKAALVEASRKWEESQ